MTIFVIDAQVAIDLAGAPSQALALVYESVRLHVWSTDRARRGSVMIRNIEP
jgi:hypothetical protein